MFVPALDKLHVLVTGVDAAIARDVVRLAAAEGARVMVADGDAGKLARLHRDLGLCRSRVETRAVDLANARDLRRCGEQLRAGGRLPQLMICCCAARRGAARTDARRVVAGDVALSERAGHNCPALAAQRMLQPPLFLHAEPLRRSGFDKAISVLRHPTLRGVLERGRPEALIPYVAQRPSGAAGRRLILAPCSDAAPKRADAA